MKLLTIIFLLGFFVCSALANEPIRVLLILAHYDDETIMASILSRLKEVNAEVEAIYLTKGEGGSDIRKTQSEVIDEAVRKAELVAQRELEIRKASEILNISKVYQVDAGDIPLRIPEPGYPNPAGRPSTSGSQFLNSGIWDIEAIENSIEKIVKENSIKPDYILTLSDDTGVIHAHHQVSNYLTTSLNKKGVFGDQVKGVFGVVEAQWYDMNRFSHKPSVLYFDVNSYNISKPSERHIDNAFKAYQAHVSQSPSKVSLAEIEQFPEVLYGLENPMSGEPYALDEISKTLQHSKVRRFENQADWIKFHSDHDSWKFRCNSHLQIK